MAAIGGLAVVTQVMVAYAASLAKPGERGPVGLRLALQLPFFKMGALSDRLVSSTPE